MIWLKFRALLLGNITRFFSFVLRIPIPPIVSVMGIIEKDGKYLVLELSYRKGYGFPGGIVEPFETLHEALIREVKEETGLEVTTSKFVTSKHDKQYGFPVLVTAFVATVSGEISNSREGKVSWQTAEQIINRASYANAKEAFVEYLKTS